MIPSAAGRRDPRGASRSAGSATRWSSIPDADHGFFCDQRATYQKAAGEDAWKRVKALFAEELR